MIFKILTRHFFQRFFDHEMLAAGGSPYATVIRALTFLFLPGFMLAMYLFAIYVDLAFKRPHLIPGMRWNNKMLFCTMAASLMSFLTALNWDSLFPNRDDFMILTPLPLRRRTIFFAKTSALTIFAALFAIAINAGPAILFPVASLTPTAPYGDLLTYVWTHAASLFLCSTFAFCCCLALQGAALNLAPARWLHSVSTMLQFMILAASASLLLLFPLAGKLAPLGQSARILDWFVPAWFAGLSEFWNGSVSPLHADLASRALHGLAIAFSLATVFYAGAYLSCLQKTIESPAREGSQSAISRTLSGWLDTLLLSNQHERGVFHFILQTLFRSPRHGLYLVGYGGVACALVIWELVTLFSARSYTVLWQPSPELLSIPLVISFFILSGIRFVYPRPAELKANWIFQVCEDPLGVRSLEAPVKVMVLLGVVPVSVLLFPVHAWLWGMGTATLHLSFATLLGLILVELLLCGFRKIPFACSFAPQGHNSMGWTMIYLIGFVVYAYTMASVEYWMLHDPVLRAAVLHVFLAGGWIAARRLRLSLLAEESRLEYDEPVEPAVRTLDLSS